MNTEAMEFRIAATGGTPNHPRAKGETPTCACGCQSKKAERILGPDVKPGTTFLVEVGQDKDFKVTPVIEVKDAAAKVTTTVPSPLSQTGTFTKPAAKCPTSVLTESEKLDIANKILAPPSLEAALKEQRDPSKTRTERLREFLTPTPISK